MEDHFIFMRNLEVTVESRGRDHNGITYSLATDTQLKFLICFSDMCRVLNFCLKFFQHCMEENKIRMEEKNNG